MASLEADIKRKVEAWPKEPVRKVGIISARCTMRKAQLLRSHRHSCTVTYIGVGFAC